MTNIEELVSLCKASVSVNVNPHRDYYEKVKDYISHNYEPGDVEADILEKMIELDTIIAVQAYPNTPIGFYFCVHWDLNHAIDDVLNAIKESKK